MEEGVAGRGAFNSRPSARRKPPEHRLRAVVDVGGPPAAARDPRRPVALDDEVAAGREGAGVPEPHGGGHHALLGHRSADAAGVHAAEEDDAVGQGGVASG